MRFTVISNHMPYACTPVLVGLQRPVLSLLGYLQPETRATMCRLVSEHKGNGWATMSTGALWRLSLPLQLTGPDLLLSSADLTLPAGRLLGVGFPCACVPWGVGWIARDSVRIQLKTACAGAERQDWHGAPKGHCRSPWGRPAEPQGARRNWMSYQHHCGYSGGRTGAPCGTLWSAGLPLLSGDWSRAWC